MRNIVRATAALLVLATGCSGGEDGATKATTTTTAAVDPQALAQAFVDDLVATVPSIPGAVVHVVAPGRDIDVGAAAGVADRATGEPLTADATFRIASNTKTFTAAATLRLVEQGEIDLDDPVSERVSDESRAALTADGYDPDAITVRHLLQHTSGLYDYGADESYQTAIVADPTHRWTRIEQVRFAMDHGDPLGPPGEVFAYSDTGYVLLGEIIERTTGQDLAMAYRELLDFEALGLDATWLETLETEPATAGPRAHQYFADLDAFGADPSFDLYGGGGLVASARDLARFYDALLAGDVFDDPATLDTMLEIPPVAAADGGAMGLYELEVGDETCWSHRGFWGTIAVACPESHLAAALSIGQALPDSDDSVGSVVELIDALRSGG